jgi:hypothetical protein
VHFRLCHIFAFASIAFLSTFAVSEGTRTWEQSKFEELNKGTAKGVAIASAGGLDLAPAFKALTTTPSTYVWSIAADSAGNLYTAAGAPARVYRIAPDGTTTTIFEPQELQVQAVAVDSNGLVYAATNPDGKIYRLEHRAGAGEAGKSSKQEARSVDPSWSSSVYFEPGTKYIWDLALDSAGNLYVATGDHGEIFRVTPKGEHSVFFKSDEAHIRVLALDLKGNLLAGSDGSGLVYRISPAGEGFVLYSAPKKEITALAVDGEGNIYAAGVGEKRTGAPSFVPGFPTIPTNPQPGTTATPSPHQPGITMTPAAGAAATLMAAFPAPGMGATGGSEVYRIAPDGSPTTVWSSREDLVYALAFNARGHLLAGTGNRGHIFAVTGEDQFTDMVTASATQVTGFAKAPSGGLYASTSNLGKVFLLGANSDSEGTYESDVFDAHIFSRWGRVEFRGAGNVDVFVRSGNVDNPDRNWSPWEKVNLKKGGAVAAPSARFVQWKAVLHAGDPAPHVSSVIINYLPKNVAPDFDDVTVQAGVRYQSVPRAPMIDASTPGGSPQPHFEPPPPSSHDPGAIGVRWTVHDDNDDQMVYSVYYRGDGETRWLLLKDNLTDKFYSFDASLLPDGGYTIKVVASDAPSHSPGQALTAEKESSRFEVDTTPPRIEALKAALENGQVHLAFSAVDSFSNIKRAECSIDAADWQFVEPVDQLSDAKSETYDFRVSLPPTANPAAASLPDPPAEHVVVVRVYDHYDNMVSAKTVITGR